MKPARSLPLHMVTLVLGTLSVPTAFAGHLVSLAVAMAAVALACRIVGWALVRAKGSDAFAARGLKLSRIGGWAALVGLAAALLMWWAFAAGRLPLGSGT